VGNVQTKGEKNSLPSTVSEKKKVLRTGQKKGRGVCLLSVGGGKGEKKGGPRLRGKRGGAVPLGEGKKTFSGKRSKEKKMVFP